MSCCGICNRVFRGNYELKRHLTRSRSCEHDISFHNLDLCVNKSTLGVNKSTGTVNLITGSVGIEKSPISSKTCRYCVRVFSSTNYKNRHILRCPQMDNPVRLLELSRSIDPVKPDHPTDCRFCKKSYSRRSLLNRHIGVCPSYMDYHENLLKTQFPVAITNNNTTNNNNTNNIVNINILGQENMDHVQIERVIDLFRTISKEFGYSRICLTAGNLINSFDRYIRETPENQNIIIPDSKSLYGTVRTPLGWEKVSADDCLNTAFKHTAAELYNRKEAMGSYNDKIFKSVNNNIVFNEVRDFAKNGLTNSVNSSDLRQIKTSFKVAKLKDRVVEF